jgi:hypothetical protein
LQAQGNFIPVFNKLVLQDLEDICKNKKSDIKYNLSFIEKKALTSLQNDNNLVIRGADKGGGVVLQDKVDYLKVAYRLLGDTNTYVKLKTNPIKVFKEQYDCLIYTAKEQGILDKSEFEFIKS